MYGRPLFFLMPLLVFFVALCKTNLSAISIALKYWKFSLNFYRLKNEYH
jgi:hypothetical protein